MAMKGTVGADCWRRTALIATAVAGCAYIAAASIESALIHWIDPSKWELAWVSDLVLSIVLGVAPAHETEALHQAIAKAT